MGGNVLKQTKKAHSNEVILRVTHRVRGQNLSCLLRNSVQLAQESYKR